MAFVDDVQRVTEAIDKISKDGVPIVVEHKIENNTMYMFIGGLAAVAVLFVVLLGVKDVLVRPKS